MKNGDNFEERFRSQSGHRNMEKIGQTIETGFALEFGRKLPIGLMREKPSSHGRTSVLQLAVDPVSTSPRFQRVFVGVLDQYRRKFKIRFLLHGDSPLHSLRTLRSHCPSDGLSSLDCRHRMRHSRRRNRGTNRSGLSSIDFLCSGVNPVRLPPNFASLYSTSNSIDSLPANLRSTRLKGLPNESYLRDRVPSS